MKILFTTTISDTVNGCLIPHIKRLIEQGHQVDVAFRVVSKVKPEIVAMGCKIYEIPFRRSPFSLDNYQAYQMLKKIIKEGKYDVVHTHTPVASACVRLACRKYKNVKVFYTAHGFHFYKGAPLKNWLIYYSIERWLARYTDLLITINQEDYIRAKRWKARQVEYIPGVGLDLERFNPVPIDYISKRKELNIAEDAIVILSIGEINRNKNHITGIKAVAKLNNPQIHYIICGQGKLESDLKAFSAECGVSNQVHFLGFRKDILELCSISNIFLFPSYREGLSIALMEAMASGLPIIASNIRGNVDLIEEGKGGYLIEPMNWRGFAASIDKVLKDPTHVKEMCEYNKEVIKKFSKEIVEEKLKHFYE